ncbi:MAG: ribose-phosphate diphosphokinase [Bdellovibrio sp.]
MQKNQQDRHQNSILKIFGIGAGLRLAREFCEYSGASLQPLREEKFPDGEIKIKPLENVAHQDIVIFQSLAFDSQKSPNEKICELLFLIGLLKNEGARYITAVLPYLAYSRSDQKKDPFDPLTLNYLARLLETIGINKLITLDVHNIAAFQNAFRCENINVETAFLFCEYLKNKKNYEELITVMSPDIGGIKRAEKFRHRLQLSLGMPVEMAFLEKYREKEGLLGHSLVGEIKSKHVIIYDDMISTGKTVLRAADIVRENGAKSLTVMAAHGLFSENPEEILKSPLIDEIVVTNSNPFLYSPSFEKFSKLKILSCVPLLAQCL